MATYQHGITSFIGAAATTYGLMQSFTENESVEVAEARDADGDVAAVTSYNLNAEFSQEVVLDITATPPAAGATLSVSASNTGSTLVTSVSRNESNTEYKRLTISSQAWITNTIPA